MPSRTIAIGDIHGCLAALDAVLNAIDPQPDDTLVVLGDVVDRGPDSRGAIARLIGLRQQCRLVPLLGNHDEMLIMVHVDGDELIEGWLGYGGAATLASYGVSSPAEVPSEHIEFLRNCPLVYETDRHFFVHANYHEDLPLDQQPREAMLWESLKRRRPGPHCSGKTAIVGHTAQKNGRILDLGHLKCIDTCCYGDGCLTALDVDTGQVWQASKKGKMRDPG